MGAIFALQSLKVYADAFAWLITLGTSEVKGVKEDIEKLIALSSASLLSFHELAREISETDSTKLTSKSFRNIHDYFREFYFGKKNISEARTHCGNVERQLNKITFRLPRLLHTNLGKWKDAKRHFKEITLDDGKIVRAFVHATTELDREFKAIANLLNTRKTKEARGRYAVLRSIVDMEADEINRTISAMNDAYSHIQKTVG
jgi:predicted AAA+ superfamily ATPase